MSSVSTEQIYETAKSNFLGGRLTEARRELEAGLAVDDESGKLWEMLGCVLHTQGIQERAVECLEQASLLVPLEDASRFILGLGYEHLERGEEASNIFRYLATRDGLEDQLLEPLARALGRRGECEAALIICLEAASREPSDSTPLMGAVFYMRRLRKPHEEVLPLLFRAHHLCPEDNECRIALAWMLHECGRSQDGAYLLSQLDIQDLKCGNCLARMRVVFRAAGDSCNEQLCLQTQQLLREGH